MNEELNELLAIHEILRRLGFDRDYIFVSCTDWNPACSCPTCRLPGGLFVIGVTLRMPAHDDFVMHVRRTTMDQNVFQKDWPKAVNEWNNLTVDQAMQIYQGSAALRAGAQIIMALVKKGFKINPGGLAPTQPTPEKKQ